MQNFSDDVNERVRERAKGQRFNEDRIVVNLSLFIGYLHITEKN